MKKLTSIFTTVILAAFLIGCASLETNAYKVIGTSAVAVDASMQAWGATVRAGKATDAQQNAVRQAYATYQLSMKTANYFVDVYHVSPKQNAASLNQALTNLQYNVFLLQQATPTPEIP